MSFRKIRKCLDDTGGTLVEFALTAVVLVMLMIGVLDVGRLVLVITTIANGARAGVRYAIVHGSDNSATTTQIKAVVKNFLGAAYIYTASATINVSYPDTTTSPGSRVLVTVSYPYSPLTAYIPLSVTLRTTSEGIITY